MPLTKARPPVTQISTVENGTTSMDISSADADIDVTVNGATVVTIGETTVTFDDLVTAVAKTVTAEIANLTKASGATGVVQATASQMDVKTSSAHPLVLGANATTGLTIGTDGKVSLAVEGTSSGHLVTKGYVDTAASVTPASLVNTSSASNGSQTITGSVIDLIIKWGTKTGAYPNPTVTFTDAFPNSCFVVTVTPTISTPAASDGWYGVYNIATTGFQINQSNRTSYTGTWNWIAIGY